MGHRRAGKSTLTAKLQKMGYSVHFEAFVELCQEFPQYPPTSAIMTLKWSQRLLKAMEEGQRRHAKVCVPLASPLLSPLCVRVCACVHARVWPFLSTHPRVRENRSKLHPLQCTRLHCTPPPH